MIDLEVSSNPAQAFLYFPCPDDVADTVRIRIEALVSNPGVLVVDQAFIGVDSSILADVNKAAFVGKADFVPVANCVWALDSANYAEFPVDTDCNFPTVSGDLDVSDEKRPEFILRNAKPGTYFVRASGQAALSAGSGEYYIGLTATTNLTSGLGSIFGEQYLALDGANRRPVDTAGTFEVTSQQDYRIALVGAETIVGSLELHNNVENLTFNVFYYPPEDNRVVVSNRELKQKAFIARARVTAGTSNVSFADNAFERVDFNDVLEDPLGTIATGASWTFTAHEAGTYTFSFPINWQSSTNLDQTSVRIIDDGGASIVFNNQFTGTGLGTATATKTLSKNEQVYFELRQIDTGTASRDLETGGSVELTIVKAQDNTVYGVYKEPTKYQVKYLPSDVTTDTTDISTIRFENMEIGKLYRVKMRPRIAVSSNSSAKLIANHDGAVIAVYLNGTPSEATDLRSEGLSESPPFVATATTVTFDFAENASATLEGNGSARETWVMLEELPSHVQTTQW